MIEQEPLRAPFPWFGGKRRASRIVWEAFGEVPNYVEPFAGSLAVLLGRPGGAGKIETVNDLDRFVANFWRAIAGDPWAVAAWCDGPVNEADLHARHKSLVNNAEFRERMHADPDFFDAKVAGWWVWGLCQWIGGGWCAEPNNRKMPKIDGIGNGVHSIAGSESHAKRPNLAGMDKGVLRAEPPHKLPFLAVKSDNNHAGRGIHSTAHLPSLGNDKGVHGTLIHTARALTVPDAPPCFEWFYQLAMRLRRVRVACGDWTRVLGPSVLGKGKNVGGRKPCAVFLDPPYDTELRASGLYSEDAAGISSQVRQWAIEHGDDPDIRIALCGYEGEHDLPENWRMVEWKAARGYAAEANDNRAKERIWFSPHCLVPGESRQTNLFDFDTSDNEVA